MSNQKPNDYRAVLRFYIKVLKAQAIPDKLYARRLAALLQLQAIVAHYEERGYMGWILYRIAQAKGKMILDAVSQTDVKNILKPSIPYYNGAKFIPGPYWVPEEELIGWSGTSFIAPLNMRGYEKYKEVFQSGFPEAYQTLFPFN